MDAFTSAKWIWSKDARGKNAYVIFRRAFSLDKVISGAVCRASASTHYFLYVNGTPAVWFGSPKRSKAHGYYDEFDISKYLVKGNNVITCYCVYYGDGGTDCQALDKAGFIFECPALKIISDSSFAAYADNNAYIDSVAGDLLPYAGADVVYDASLEGQLDNILSATFNSSLFLPAEQLGEYGEKPWGNLEKSLTPIYSVSAITCPKREKVNPQSVNVDPKEGEVYSLSLNRAAHFSPCLEVVANGREKITVFSDMSDCKGVTGRNRRIEFTAAPSNNKFEGLCDMFGTKVYFVVPQTVKIISLGVRIFTPSLERTDCLKADGFINSLIAKATDTIENCMSSNYIDAPDCLRSENAADVSIASRAGYYAFKGADGYALKTALDILNTADETGIIASGASSLSPTENAYESLVACGEFGIFANLLNFSTNTDFATAAAVAVRDYLFKWYCAADNQVQQLEVSTSEITQTAVATDAPVYDDSDLKIVDEFGNVYSDEVIFKDEESKLQDKADEKVDNSKKGKSKKSDKVVDAKAEEHVAAADDFAQDPAYFEASSEYAAIGEGIAPRAKAITSSYNLDGLLIENALYYSACKNAINLGKISGVNMREARLNARMKSIEKLFDMYFDNGYCRGNLYDDRVNAFAVLSGLCPKKYYGQVTQVLRCVMCATPLTEWAVIQALIVMGEYKCALNRLVSRYKPLTDDKSFTLPETFNGNGSLCRASASGILSALISATAEVLNGASKVKLTPNVSFFGSYSVTVNARGSITMKVINKGDRVDCLVENNSESEVYLIIEPACLPCQVQSKTVKLTKGKNKFSW